MAERYLRGVDAALRQATLDKNPLRILDCKEPGCQEATRDAPRLVDHLCEPCAAHFARHPDRFAAA